jgi:hypothetical protein
MYQVLQLALLYVAAGINQPTIDSTKGGLHLRMRYQVGQYSHQSPSKRAGNHPHPLYIESMKIKSRLYLDVGTSGGSGNGVRDTGEPVIGIVITINHSRGMTAPDGDSNYSSQLAITWIGGLISIDPFP